MSPDEHADRYLDERSAARYDESAAVMFDPAVADPTVDFLAELRWPLTSDSDKHVSVGEKP